MKATCKANKLLAMLLSLVMLVGLLPTTALAAGEIAVTEVNFTLSGYELGKKVVDVKPATNTTGVTWNSDYKYLDTYFVTKGDDIESAEGITDDAATFAASTQYWLVVLFKADNGYAISALTQEKIKLNGVPAADITKLSYENEGSIAAFFKLDKLTGSTPSTPTVVDTVDFTLNGYELGNKVVNVIPTTSTTGVTWGNENKYDGAYFVAKGDDFDTRENIKISNDTATFAADTQYWLGVLFKAVDGYDISALTQEKIKLNRVSAYKITQYSSGSIAAFFKLDKLTGSTPSTPTVVDAVDFTLSGYKLGEKVVDVKPAINTSGVTWNGENEYCGAYVVWQSEDDPTSIPDPIPADSTATFAADTQYWLSVLIKAVDGYNISALTIENIKLNGVAAVGFSANIKDGSIQANFKLNRLTESTPTEYTISFDVNGGTGTVPSQTTSGHKLTTLPTAIRSGSYSFAGWYTAASGGTKITASYEFAANTTVYAHWTYTGSSGGGGGSHYTYYTITASADDNGSISPSGSVSVLRGADKTFTITPNDGYAVAKVLVDGKDVGAVKSYTFEDVKTSHTISVVFMEAKSDPQASVFVDVETGSYYRDAVDWAVSTGITKGTTDTTFSPDGICTRAQAVTFLWRAAGSPEPETVKMPFEDVSADAYYFDAVLWAVENGITVGTTATTFSPDINCSRAQIVSFLWRSQGSPVVNATNIFTDVDASCYYYDAVMWAVKNSVTGGTTATTFSPDVDCTRAQIVTFMWRALAE